VRRRRGGGAAPGSLRRATAVCDSTRARGPSQRGAHGDTASAALAGHSRRPRRLAVRALQAHPLGGEGGCGRPRSARCGTQAGLHITGRCACAQALDRPRPRRREPPPRGAVGLGRRQPGPRVLSGLVAAQPERGRCRNSPLAGGGPAECARRAPAWAPGGFGARHESTLRSAILSTGAALPRRDVRAQPAPAACAQTRHRLAPGQGLGIGVLGRLGATACESAPPLRIRRAPGEVARAGRGDRRGITACGDAVAGGVLRAGFVARGPGRWGLGLWAMRQKGRAVAPQGRAAAAPLARGAPLSGRARGVGAHAAASAGGTLVRGARGVWGRAAVQRVLRQGVPQDKRPRCLSAQGGAPIPGAEPCNRATQAIPGGSEGLAAGCRRRVHLAVPPAVASRAHATDGQGAGGQGDPAGKLLRRGGASP
jgi:hypothetical protein